VTREPFIVYAANAFFWVYSLEIARMIRVPEAEKPDVDTYSKLLGSMGGYGLAHRKLTTDD